jgi:hypothetical protein
LLGAWALATLGATAAMTARIHHKQSALGLTAQQVGFPVFWTFLPLWAVGLSCVAFTVHRRVIAGSASFGRAAALASFKAFLLGTFAYLIVFAILDIASVIHF